MKSIRNLIFGLAALLAVFAAQPQVQAAQLVMCAPDAVAAATGARRVTNPNTGTSYSLNSAGCATIAFADVGYFVTQGYTTGPSLGSLIYNTGALPSSGTTDIVLGSIPAGAYIQQIIVSNSVASAVTGNLAFGTTANATDIVNGLVCAANCLAYATDSQISKRVFSNTAAQTIHMAPISSSNSTNLTVDVIWGIF